MTPEDKRSLVFKYGEVYSLSTGVGRLYFREPTKRENEIYNDIIRTDAFKGYIYLFDACTFFDDGFDHEKFLVGDIVRVSNIIITTYGIDSEYCFFERLSQYRQESQTVENQYKIIVMRAFPNITQEDMENMSVSKFAKHCAIAEKITGMTVEIEVPKAEKKDENAAQKILNSLPDQMSDDDFTNFSPSGPSETKQFIDFESENEELRQEFGGAGEW
jgi:hypothetical protein